MLDVSLCLSLALRFAGSLGCHKNGESIRGMERASPADPHVGRPACSRTLLNPRESSASLGRPSREPLGASLLASGRALRRRRPVLGPRSARSSLLQASPRLHPWVDRAPPCLPHLVFRARLPPPPPCRCWSRVCAQSLSGRRREGEAAGKEGPRSGCVYDGVGDFLWGCLRLSEPRRKRTRSLWNRFLPPLGHTSASRCVFALPELRPVRPAPASTGEPEGPAPASLLSQSCPRGLARLGQCPHTYPPSASPQPKELSRAGAQCSAESLVACFDACWSWDSS